MKTLSGLKPKNGLLGAWLSNKEKCYLSCEMEKNMSTPSPQEILCQIFGFSLFSITPSHGEINGKQGHHQCNEKGYFFLL